GEPSRPRRTVLISTASTQTRRIADHQLSRLAGSIFLSARDCGGSAGCEGVRPRAAVCRGEPAVSLSAIPALVAKGFLEITYACPSCKGETKRWVKTDDD